MFFEKWIEETEIPDRYINHDIVTVKQWLAVLCVTFAPGLNIVMLLKWALRSEGEEPTSLINWARAALILMVISAVVATGMYFLLRLLGIGIGQ
jgi:hypothetical protein